MRNRTTTASHAPARIRISGPSELVGAIPHLLGFSPRDSLVLLCLRLPGHTVGPVVRIDLADAADPGAVEQLIGCAHQHADAAALVCYHDRSELPACLGPAAEALDAEGIERIATLSVHRGRIRDACCRTAYRSDPGIEVPGADDAQVTALAAASTLAGRRVLPDRRTLRDSIAGPSGALAAECAAAIEEAARRRAGDAGSGPPSTPITRASEALARCRAVYAASCDVTIPVAAALISAVRDIATRDAAISLVIGADRAEILPVLIAAARRCPDEYAADVCAVLAVAAYRCGDGALAQCAVDRALRAEPGHRLARLMAATMASGLPPDRLDGLGGSPD